MTIKTFNLVIGFNDSLRCNGKKKKMPKLLNALLNCKTVS